MLEMLIRKKAELLRYDVCDALDEAVRRKAPLDQLFELAGARDALDGVAGRGDADAAAVVRGVEQQLRQWDRDAAAMRA